VRLAAAHARVLALELARQPAYVVPTLAFPTLFFLIFAGGPAADANARLARFAAFAAIGVAFFQFGVGIAGDRASPWELYLRTLPVPAWSRFAARLVPAAAFAAAAAGLVAVAAMLATPVSLSASAAVAVAATLLAGTIPFGLLGIALGYWAPPRASLPLANLLYLSLSYAGGLWIPPDRLPPAVEPFSRLLPTRALADALAAAAAARPAPPGAWLELAAFSVLFAALAAAGYARDEGRRFR